MADDARQRPPRRAEYVNHLCDQGKAPATIAQAMACIRSMHTRAGHDNDPPLRFADLVFRGYKRARAYAGAGGQKMAPALSPTNLRRMIETCDLGTLLGARDRVLLVLGYGLMGRRSELVALNVSDVTEDEVGLLVYIGKSKTDQDAEGETVAVPRGAFDNTDPVAALHRWLEALASREGNPTGRLLRSLTKGGGLGRSLSPGAVSDVVKDRARRAELPNPDSYSAHSLRAGGPTAALRAGVPIGVAARHGRWKPTSPVVNKYARTEDRWRDNAMRGVL